jgi:general stress protein YciG
MAHRLQPECLLARECEEEQVAKEDRGFASMDRNKQREIASKGGKAAHQKGTAHEWTSEEAREAGRKGGMASHRRKQEQQQNPEEGSGGSGSESAMGSVNTEQMMGTDNLP